VSEPLQPISDLISAIRAGGMVVLVDDEDRENEGDLVMAADCVTPEAINFMARFGRGLICLTLTEARCRQLQLPMMVHENRSAHATAFTVSIEAARGVTTGISAADRAATILAAVAPAAKPDDLVQPGHIFPLMAQPGGVLARAGHTEAGCDLAQLAGHSPAGVICEILNDDGSMARLPDLRAFAKAHGLPLGSIADLIHHRTAHESLVERVSEEPVRIMDADWRLVAYKDRAMGHRA
jgi:3,4-dihydroxy 2-butanone 4-phosphate synthase/GTP cyclohydrolase II